MSPIDQILELLRDGKWHETKENAEETRLHEFARAVGLIMSFLAKYDFIELDTKEKKTRLTPPLLSYLKKIQSIEIENQ